jgi:hypothetical protein
MLILDGSFLDLPGLDQCRDRIFEVAAIPRRQRAPQLRARGPVTSVIQLARDRFPGQLGAVFAFFAHHCSVCMIRSSRDLALLRAN